MITVLSRTSKVFKGLISDSPDFQKGLEAAMIAIECVRIDGKATKAPNDISAAIREVAGTNTDDTPINKFFYIPVHTDEDYK